MLRARVAELKKFLGSSSPEVAKVALRVRAFVLMEAPLANEFVYETGNAVEMGYGFTKRPADAFCRIAVRDRWVDLGFDRGSLLADPAGVLEGSGSRVRHVRIENLDDLRKPQVGRFLRAAMKAAPDGAAEEFGERSAPGAVIGAVHSRKRRPRRRKEEA
jgi:hypothetical protein